MARRIALGAITVWLITIAAFLLLRIAPGDAVTAAVARSPGEGGLAAIDAASLRQELGLDRSWPVQYADWLGDTVRLDAGRSLATGRSVVDEIGPRVSVTLELALFALLFTVCAGTLLGIVAASGANRNLDAVIRAGALLFISVPVFWLGLVLVMAVANWTGHFLSLGYEPLSGAPGANLAAVLPAAAVLAARPAALLTRVVRSSTLEATESQFFLLARARGLGYRTAIARHAFRTAMLPSLTVLGAQAVFLLGGAVVIEQIFGLPGLGRLLVSSVLARDFPVVQSLVVLYGTTAIAVNLAVDAAYVWLDPRLRGSR